MELIKAEFIKNYKLLKKIIMFVLFSILIYTIAAIYNDLFVRLTSITGYLTWHVIFEFISILVSVSIFTVTYYVYEESANFSMIVLGCAFLTMGLFDVFHTFSFKGMSDFFISNTTANRATTLWILARTLGSLGFLLSVLTPANLRVNIKKETFAVTTTVFSIFLFLIVTYFPIFFPPMFIEETGLTMTKIVMEYVIILIMAITFVVILSKYKKTGQRIDHQFMVALILLMFSEFAFTNYGNVYDIFNYIGHIYKIIASLILYKVIYIENVVAPYKQLKKAKNELKKYSENLNVMVKQRTKEILNMNSMLLKDIEYAREMQLRLMPEKMPENTSVSFCAEYLPAERLSGDFYNVLKLDENNIALYLGDVSGHGVSAAMLTIFANQNIIPFNEDENNSRTILPPTEVLNTIYNGYNNTNFSDETYIIMLYGIYNTKSKLLTYASAGMNVSPYIIKRSGELLTLNSSGFSICKLAEFITPTFEEKKVKLEEGDKLFVYSDGLIESRNENNEFYGQERMERFLKENSILNANELKIALRENLCNYIGHIDRLKDDATYIIMEIP